MSHLNKLHQKYAGQGLTIIGLNPQEEEITHHQFSLYNTPFQYKVFIKPKAMGIYPGNTVPRTYLIGPDGKGLWKGNSPSELSDSKITEFLAERSRYLYQKFQGAPKEAINRLIACQVGKSYKLALKAAETEKNPEKKKAAEDLVLFNREILHARLSHAQKLFEQREYLKAKIIYMALEKEVQETPMEKEVKQKLALYQNPDVKAEFEALVKVDNLVRPYLTSKDRKKKEYPSVARTLQSLANSKSFQDTLAAQKARELAIAFSEK